MRIRYADWAIVLVVISLLLLLGCFSRPVSNSSTINIGGPLVVEMWASSNCAKAGDTINLRATVTNRSNKNWRVELDDQPVFDIITSDERGPIRWSDGKPLTDLTHLELRPGESKTLEMDLIVPRNLQVGFLSAQARYFYSATAPGGPVRPGVVIHVGDCYVLGP